MKFCFVLQIIDEPHQQHNKTIQNISIIGKTNDDVEIQKHDQEILEAPAIEKTRGLLDLFLCCFDVATFLNNMEAELFKSKILSERKPEPLIKLELLLYELASDPHLTDGVFYAITISLKNDGEKRRKCNN